MTMPWSAKRRIMRPKGVDSMRKLLSLSVAAILVANPLGGAPGRAAVRPSYEEQENAILIALIRYQISQNTQGAVCVKDTLDAPPSDLRAQLIGYHHPDPRPPRAAYERDLRRVGRSARPIAQSARPIDLRPLVAAGFSARLATLEECAPLTAISMARPIIRSGMAFSVGYWSNACFSSPYHASIVRTGRAWAVKYHGAYAPVMAPPGCSPSRPSRMLGTSGEKYIIVGA